MPLGTPEPPHRRELAALLSQQQQATAAVTTMRATLHQTDADGREYDVHLMPKEWSVIPGRPGVLLFVIPHPTGRPGLWMAAFYVEPHSEYTGSSLAERRVVTVLEGELDCNGRLYQQGQTLVIEPHEATTWCVTAGAAGVTLYETVSPA